MMEWLAEAREKMYTGEHANGQRIFRPFNVDEVCIFIKVCLRVRFLLRLCRNCFCTCGIAVQKTIFAVLPQKRDKTKMYLDKLL
jgi:hypothetical protein